MRGDHLVKAWSRTQATIALSSAEAELYAMVKTSAEIIGLQSMLKDWGVEHTGRILGDATACLGLISRQGVGKLRHLNTNFLWVQQKAASNELKYSKVCDQRLPSTRNTCLLAMVLSCFMRN